MNTIKRTFPYVLSIIISSLCLISMLFAYIVMDMSMGDLISLSVGCNGYEIINVTDLGFWSVMLCITSLIFVIFLISVIVLSLLEILNDLGVVKFEVTFRRVTSLILVKFLLFLMLILAFLEMLFTIFLVIANSEQGFVLGAGTFVLFGVVLVGFILFLFLDRADYFKTWSQLPKHKKEIVIKPSDTEKKDETGEVIVEKNE